MADLSELAQRFWSDILARPHGPYAFRFALQPTMAAIAALVDGIKDARAGRSPYFWTVVYDRELRAARLREGIRATKRILLLGVVMELLYQLPRFKTLYVGEAVVIVFGLCFVPYLLMRGPVARIAKHYVAPHDKTTRPSQVH
jgi:hypothetical protein